MNNKITIMKLKDIKPYEKNPRKNNKAVDAVAESIKEFGFQNPIIIDKNNVIIAGHTRYKAAKKLNIKDVPVIVAENLNEEQANAYRLIDNKTNELAEWDDTLLFEELLNIENIDMSLFGFDLDIEEDEKEIIEDDFEIKIPEKPKSKIGDIYQLGDHRLMCGDSTDEDSVLKLMENKKADMFLTDPPYNVDYEGKTKNKLKIENDKMKNDDFKQFLIDAFANANQVMKNGAVFYIWHADSEGYNFRGACFDIGWKVRQCLIWNKNSMVMGRQDYHWKHEPCLYGWKDGASHLGASDRKQTTVINFDMKPILLFDYQIKNNTKGGDIVLDLFGGSGTTIMACEQNGRISYTMEFDPKYVDVIIERWEKFTGKKAVLLNE